MIDGETTSRVWPSTFDGLYIKRLIRKTLGGTYTISDEGREAIK